MKTIGETISDIILTNIKVWHEDTKLRNNKEMTAKEKVGYGMRGRVMNKIRSDLKYEINKYFKDNAFDDRKVNYTKE
jgi:hypothetical protein